MNIFVVRSIIVVVSMILISIGYRSSLTVKLSYIGLLCVDYKVIMMTAMKEFEPYMLTGVRVTG